MKSDRIVRSLIPITGNTVYFFMCICTFKLNSLLSLQLQLVSQTDPVKSRQIMQQNKLINIAKQLTGFV